LGESGFSSAEEKDGYAEYVSDNAGSCAEDPRLESVQVEAKPNHAPVLVSYVHASGIATFKHPEIGFTLDYPRRFHLQQVSYGGAVSTEGVEVANYSVGPATNGRPLSSGAVDFSFTTEDFAFRSSSGPLPGSPHELKLGKLPLVLTDADLRSGAYRTAVSGDGLTFTLSITTGSSPSHQDLDALRAMAASIHLPRLRIGHFTPAGLYVLGPASKYRPGSVTEVPAGYPLPYYKKLRSGRFYLERTAGGFWTLTWPSTGYIHGYRACGPHFDVAKRRFTCPNGAVWDLQGRVVKNPDPPSHPDDPLERTHAAEADGYVLVSLEPPPR
jgi:hypothetical protein